MWTDFIRQICFLTILVVNIFNERDKIYIYPPYLHQDQNQKLNKCFSNYLPLHIIPNILSEEDIDLVFEEVNSNEDF